MVKLHALPKGFTLIELLVVISIIGVLSTMAMVSLNSARQKARDAKRTSDMKQMQTALELYFGDKGTYPYGTISSVVQNGTLGIGSHLTLSSGSGFATSGTSDTYMGLVPSAPTPPPVATEPRNIYDYKATATNYVISFWLESDTGGLLAGPNCATPSGLLRATGGPPPVCPNP